MAQGARTMTAPAELAPASTGTLQQGRRGFWIYFTIALLAAATLSFHFLAKGKAFAFYGFGSDTFFAYYPYQLAVARQLQTLHDLTWSFELGLGGYLGTLIDPLWLFTGWLPAAWQLPLRLPLFLFGVVAGGGFFYGYLRSIGLRPLVAVIGGLGYAFSSYGTINSQWEVPHGTEFVQFAALLYFFEGHLRTRGACTGIAAGVAVGAGHPLGLYMLGLFAIAYGAARLVAIVPEQRKSVLLAYLTFAAWAALGLALTAPLFFPALYYLLENPRVSGEHSQLQSIAGLFFSLNDRSTIGAEIAGLVGKDLLGTDQHYSGWTNYFEGPGFYVGLLPLLCIPQLFGPRATRHERILARVGIAGCCLYFAWPALRYAVYGFGHFAFRFSTLWISALLLVLGLAGLQRALTSGWWRPGIILGTGLILAIALGALVLVPETVDAEHAARVIAFVAVYAVLARLTASAGGKPWGVEYLLVALCACELVTFALPALVQRDAVNADGSTAIGRYDDNTIPALAAIRQLDDDRSFFRIEKTYSSVFLNDALAQDYPGTASYYFHATSITRFVDRMGLPRPTQSPNYIGSMASRPDVLDLLGVRYVLTRKRNLDNVARMTFLETFGDVDVYRNNGARGFGMLFDALASEAEADALPVPQRDALLLAKAIVEDPAQVAAGLAAMGTPSPSPDARRRVHIEQPRDDQLYGEVATPNAALLLLPMPFDRGWTAWLDGKELALFRADYGLTAALIPPGAHTIALGYVPPGRQLGFAAMAGALVFLAVFEWFPLIRRSGAKIRSRPAASIAGPEPAQP
jgi:hypothetical protein